MSNVARQPGSGRISSLRVPLPVPLAPGRLRTVWPPLSLVLCLVLSPRPAAAQDDPVGEDFTRRDRTALLYQTKFQFTPDNIPIVNVLVSEGEVSARFVSDAPLEFLPEGEGGPVLTIGTGRLECTARIEDGRPARIRHWVALGRVRAGDLSAVRKERDAWEARGVRVRSFERGSVFGFFGKVLDNRTHILVEDAPFDSAGAARTRRDALAVSSGNATLDVFEEAVERPSGRIVVQCDGVDARLEFPGLVSVGTAANRFIRVKSVEYGKGFPWHGREDRAYRGRLLLTPDRNGRLAVVNAIDAESLLKGLVPSEIYVDSPPEALKAQAVCARGELFAKLGNRHTADPYMVCSDVHCQVYKGALKEDPRTNAAVDGTRGHMAFVGGELVDSVYSASCGGHTENGAAVWQGSHHAYLKGVADGPDAAATRETPPDDAAVRAFVSTPPAGLYCGSTRYGKESFRWKKVLTGAEIRAGVKAQTGRDPGDVQGLRIGSRGVSGRILSIEVDGSLGTVAVSPELAIRKALGGLKSSMFVVDVAGGRWTFTGGGFGHGVGMCQVGAIGMANTGLDFKSILRHYFTGSEVGKIY